MASLYFLSCSTLAGMTLQLLACLVRVQLLAACKPRATREIQSRVPASLHNLEHFFTLSHTLSLHDSHLNIGLLITKIQANLIRNKANKMVDKIQPYTNHAKMHLTPVSLIISSPKCQLELPWLHRLLSLPANAIPFHLVSFIYFYNSLEDWVHPSLLALRSGDSRNFVQGVSIPLWKNFRSFRSISDVSGRFGKY